MEIASNHHYYGSRAQARHVPAHNKTHIDPLPFLCFSLGKTPLHSSSDSKPVLRHKFLPFSLFSCSLTPQLLLSHHSSSSVYHLPLSLPSTPMPTLPILHQTTSSGSHGIYAQHSFCPSYHEWAVKEGLHRWPRWLESLS